MLGLKNHEFSISEDNIDGLYRLICKLEDNNIPFKLDEEKESVNLSIKNFLNNWDLLETLFITDTINELQRDGEWLEIKIPIIENKCFINIQDDFYIDPFTGDWKDSKTSGDITKLLSHYGGTDRNENIYRYSALRDILTWGTIGEDIIRSVLVSLKNYKKFFIELVYMTCKVKFINEDYITGYESFIQTNTFPKSVPWIDHKTKSSGVWIGNLKYYKNKDLITTFPPFELIFEDIEPEYVNLFRSLTKENGVITAILGNEFKYEIYNAGHSLRFLDPIRAESFRHLGKRNWWVGYDEITYEIYQHLDLEEQKLIKKGWDAIVKKGLISPPNPISNSISWATGDHEFNNWIKNKIIVWD